MKIEELALRWQAAKATAERLNHESMNATAECQRAENALVTAILEKRRPPARIVRIGNTLFEMFRSTPQSAYCIRELDDLQNLSGEEVRGGADQSAT